MRRALLTWYDSNRRRLPWRGDAPPFTGSGARSEVEKRRDRSLSGRSQPTLTAMFKPKAAAKPSEQDGKAADAAPAAAPAAPPVPRSGYATWVSEIMLQQTRVEAVIPHFLRWMERFPTAQSLADAPEEDAVALWAGLGYYRRARLLHKGARHVRDALGGQLPTTVEGLKEVPGIGDYTAGAVASIAFDKQAPIVDGNVIRVVARLAARPGAANDPDLKRYSWAVASALVPPAPARPAADNDEGRIGAAAGAAAASPTGRARADAEPIDPEGASADALQGDEERRAASQAAPGTAAAAAAEAAAPTMPKAEGDCPSPPGESVEAALRRPGAFNQALMELGATVCTPQTPDCAHCPVSDRCRAYALQRAGAPLEAASTEVGDVEDLGLGRHGAKAGPRPSGPTVEVCAFPAKAIKAASREEDVDARAVFLLQSQGRGQGGWILLQRRPEAGLLSGQWDLPQRITLVSAGGKAAGKRARAEAVAAGSPGAKLPRLAREASASEAGGAAASSAIDGAVLVPPEAQRLAAWAERSYQYVFSGSTQQVSVHCEHWTTDSDAEPSVPRAEGDWRWVPLADLGQEALSSFAARALAAAIRPPLKGAAAPALGAHLRESGAKSVGTILGRAKLLTRAKKEGWWR